MFEYKKMSKNELEQVIKNASLKIGVNEVIPYTPQNLCNQKQAS